MDSPLPQPTPVDPVIVTTKSALKAMVAESFSEALKQAQNTTDETPPEAFGWVTNKEAMRLLGLSKPTLARYRSNGTIPYSRFGSKVYYKLSDLETLLSERLVSGTSKPSPR